MKSFGVRFYQGSIQSGHEKIGNKTVSDILLSFIIEQNKGKALPQTGDGPLKHELRDLTSLNNGKVIQGVLALVRDDAPHIRKADGGEKPIELSDEEGLLEKNHFLLYAEKQVLVWQVNGKASHISRFEKHLTECCGMNVLFSDILQEGAFERLQNGMMKSLRFKIANHKNKKGIDPHDWESDAFNLMSGIDGTIVDVKISTQRKKKGLARNALDAIHRMMNRGDISTLQVKMDGETEPIDLLTDRISDRINVQMAGHYPIPEDIFHQLANAKDRQQKALESSLGTGDNVLE